MKLNHLCSDRDISYDNRISFGFFCSSDTILFLFFSLRVAFVTENRAIMSTSGAKTYLNFLIGYFLSDG